MGAYLSQPKTDKVSTDELSDRLIVGASSMQGWRNNQEDAHNAIINFDVNTSFFAVYDGHGGAEVATYCADRLPDFLKQLDMYKNGKLEDALKHAFLEFDRTLLKPEVVEVLKILAGEKNVDDSDNMEYEEDEEDLVNLHEESHLPLSELLEKYKGHPSMPDLKRLRSEADNSSESSGSKPQSPYLRGRRTAAIVAQATNKALMDPDSKPQGSSTSAAALAALNNDANPSQSSGSTKSSENCVEPVEDSTVSSSSGANKAHNNIAHKNISSPEAEPSNVNGSVATASSTSAIKSAEATSIPKPDSSNAVKSSGQNGSVTSSETNSIISTAETSTKSSVEDSTVSGSNDTAKQNGNIDSSQQSSSAKPDGGISSTTSKSQAKTGEITASNSALDDDEEDAEYNFQKSAELSSDSDAEDEDEDIDGEQDDDEENASDADSDEFEEDEDEEEDDDEDLIANQQFCANMIEEPGKDSGCTAVVALLHGRDLYVANAGDSRCVVCRNGKAIEMSLDHKPEDEEESARIIKAGGRVTLDGRVNGGLNLSRAIGDHAYKMNADLALDEQMISARPDIKKLIITPEDEFMVLACDGIWNFMSSDEVVEFVRIRLTDDKKLMSEICEELFDHCLAPDTMGDGTGCDNMTAVIVRFQPKMLELPTQINPEEAEDALLTKQSAAANVESNDHSNESNDQRKAQKRIASPVNDDDLEDNTNEAEQANKTKRIKTDNDVENNLVNQTDDINSMETDAAPKMNVAGCSKQNECDSVAPITTAQQTTPTAPAVSTT